MYIGCKRTYIWLQLTLYVLQMATARLDMQQGEVDERVKVLMVCVSLCVGVCVLESEVEERVKVLIVFVLQRYVCVLQCV